MAKKKKKVAKVDVKGSDKTSVAKLDTQPAKLVIVENLPVVEEYAKVMGAEPVAFGGPITGGLGYTRIPPTDKFEEGRGTPRRGAHTARRHSRAPPADGRTSAEGRRTWL